MWSFVWPIINQMSVSLLTQAIFYSHSRHEYRSAEKRITNLSAFCSATPWYAISCICGAKYPTPPNPPDLGLPSSGGLKLLKLSVSPPIIGTVFILSLNCPPLSLPSMVPWILGYLKSEVGWYDVCGEEPGLGGSWDECLRMSENVFWRPHM